MKKTVSFNSDTVNKLLEDSETELATISLQEGGEERAEAMSKAAAGKGFFGNVKDMFGTAFQADTGYVEARPRSASNSQPQELYCTEEEYLEKKRREEVNRYVTQRLLYWETAWKSLSNLFQIVPNADKWIAACLMYRHNYLGMVIENSCGRCIHLYKPSDEEIEKFDWMVKTLRQDVVIKMNFSLPLHHDTLKEAISIYLSNCIALLEEEKKQLQLLYRKLYDLYPPQHKKEER